MRRPILIALVINACWLADVHGEKFTSKLPLMPDLCQTDAAFASLPDGGKYWCGPAALANALIAMDRCCYDNLVEGDVTSKRAQLDLLNTLGQTRYLRMRKNGIGPIAAMVGIENYVRDRGYDVTVAWQGWRHGDEFATAEFVDPRWLREGVLGDSNVVLNVGWYKHDPVGALYCRIGGHYMTLAGYENDGESTTWLIHDPAARSGTGKVTHHARLVPIQAGRLAPWKHYQGQSAVGHFRIEGVAVKSTADVAILDGAIRFAISSRN